jgi:hypothetical protein
VGLSVVLADVWDDFAYSFAPAGIVVVVLAGTAIALSTYGALTILQVLGVDDGMAFLRTTHRAALAAILPTIPLALLIPATVSVSFRPPPAVSPAVAGARAAPAPANHRPAGAVRQGDPQSRPSRQQRDERHDGQRQSRPRLPRPEELEEYNARVAPDTETSDDEYDRADVSLFSDEFGQLSSQVDADIREMHDAHGGAEGTVDANVTEENGGSQFESSSSEEIAGIQGDVEDGEYTHELGFSDDDDDVDDDFDDYGDDLEEDEDGGDDEVWIGCCGR